MKAMFIKELRENIRWAVLLGIMISLLLAWVMLFSFFEGDYLLFASDSTYFATIVGFSGAALVLGLLQSLQDQRGGRYAFVMHRPATASTIFWIKALAGLVLYLSVTAIPLLAVAIWSATPGNAPAPFDWHMTIPCIWDLINGVSWYFTGMLIGSRPVRWIGSRIMPLGAVGLCTFFALKQSQTLGDALLYTAVALAVVVPAAWGSFVYRGAFERQPAIIRGLQTIMVTIGLALTVFAGWALVWNALDTLLPRRNSNLSSHYTSWDYRIDAAGRIVRMEHVDFRDTRATDPAGNPLEPLPSNRPAILGYDFGQLSTPFRGGNMGSGFHSQWRFVRSVSSDFHQFRWYYVVSRQTIEGFDVSSRRFIGSVGPDGFAPASQSPQAFPLPIQFANVINPSWVKLVYDGTHAYLIDFGDLREVRLLVTTTPDDPILDLSALGYYRDPQYLVLTAKSFRVIGRDRETLRVPLQLDSPRIAVARQTDGSFTLLCAPVRQYRQPESKYRAITISADGQTVEQKELPALPDPVTSPPVPPGPYEPWWIRATRSIALPPALVWWWVLYYEVIHGGRGVLVAFAPAVLVLIAVSCGGVAFWLSRRQAFSRAARIVWTCFAALLGLPGLAALAAMRNWPARVKCPSCGKPRVVSHEACEHCNAHFAPPLVQGIEIIE